MPCWFLHREDYGPLNALNVLGFYLVNVFLIEIEALSHSVCRCVNRTTALAIGVFFIAFVCWAFFLLSGEQKRHSTADFLPTVTQTVCLFSWNAKEGKLCSGILRAFSVGFWLGKKLLGVRFEGRSWVMAEWGGGGSSLIGLTWFCCFSYLLIYFYLISFNLLSISEFPEVIYFRIESITFLSVAQLLTFGSINCLKK